MALKNAAHNATYNIRLIQTPTSVTMDCGSFMVGEATLTTDARGNGHTIYQEPVLSGAHDAFVVLNNAADPSNDFYTTAKELFF